MVQDVYVIGSKGIPARYGGYETFVEKLTAGRQNRDISYHVAAKRSNSNRGSEKRFVYNNADVYNINVPNIGPAQAIYYDIAALKFAIQDAKQRQTKNPIFLVLACRIGPFIKRYVKQIHSLGGAFYVNPDGHEWKRAKWSYPVRRYWKLSESLMIKWADLVVCDNRKIQEYIETEYPQYHPLTTYIAYGTELKTSHLSSEDTEVRDWFSKHSINENNYYLIVGRFVPENNYETMISEFKKSNTKRELVIIANIEENAFYRKLLKETNFQDDSRIKFVGTVYNEQLLKYIRENAYAYLHGHEVGGTNPSLLEAMSATKLNLLIDVGFNRDVAEDSALYWTKAPGNLSQIINQADALADADIKERAIHARSIVRTRFTWEKIIREYEASFTRFVVKER
ncbi:beta 1-4 rhamnosyltransferase Cps2T [Lacticaseibacillus sp. 866-1]|uniref:beta 1-4 rhamnosyltransferase Cps2T n=1 Tax=Lacticaseibacillus sp. 866-1 TaxID=2799576 RepID=UPI001942BAB4|nr:DUF1972 domain-containing protein [Lacticaseibacillus sp. 866-1]